MTTPNRNKAPAPPTTARLRHDIDRGTGGDKVAHPDPAAAPLGTDDEAAGRSPSAERVARAQDQQNWQCGPTDPNRSAHRATAKPPSGKQILLVITALVLVAAVAGWITS